MTASALMVDRAPLLRRQSTLGAILYVVMATATLFPHFILSAYLGAPGLAVIALLTGVALVLSGELAFALLLLCLFAQNLFIAIVTPLASDIDHFNPMLATSFLNIAITSVYCGLAWFGMRKHLPADSKSLMLALVIFFIVISVYTLLGIVSSSLNDALIYMRVYVIGGLMLAIGIVFGFRLSPAYTANTFRCITFIIAVWGVLEFFFTYDLYTIFHIADYIRLKYATSDTMDIQNVQQAIDFASRAYLNLSGALGLDFKLLRPQGPNIHPISYAYALAFGALVSFIYRRDILTVLCLALLLLVGAKGPCIMAFMSIILALLYRLSHSRFLLLATLISLMFFYTVIGIAYGLYTEDYHVVGLMGGVKGFLSNPIGRGVGVGGNLSTMSLIYTNFNLFQGYGATFALESAFGVMIYQIGIGAAAFFFFYWRLWKNVWKAVMHFSTQPRLVAIPCALGLLLVNSIFQEEAFSPAGWGPLMLLSGLLLAQYWQAIGKEPQKTTA